MRIVAVGECTRDRYPSLGLETVGGISLNFAVNSRRSGADVAALVSCVGTDLGADRIRDKLGREGVDTTALHVKTGPTASQLVQLEAGGERIFPVGGYDPGVLADFRLEAPDLAFIRTFDLVAVPFFRQIEHLFWPAIEAAGPRAKRVVDLLDGADLGSDLAGVRPMLGRADLIFLSGAAAVGERLAVLAHGSPTVIVVTHGANGSSALAGGQWYRMPAARVPLAERIDTTGCGDAFQAAFAIEFFRAGDVTTALAIGAEQASRAIRHVGATGE